jgi:NAD(P)-dependent dehydrogenase (short-subunit alcohol dehydrogenase family)/acyl carrier protein
VLTSLVGAILADREHDAIALDASAGKRCGITDLARVLARLAAAGCRVKLAEWDPDCPEPVTPKMRVPLVGANYRAPRKPLPPPLKIANRTAHESAGPTGDRPQSPATPQLPTNPERKPVAQDARPMSTQPTNRQVPQRDTNAPVLPDVLNVVQEGLRAMQALQQQTAKAHERFLEGQELAHKTFQQVIASQQRLMEHALGAPVLTPAPALPQAPVYDTPRHTPKLAEVESVTPAAQSAAPEPAPVKVTDTVIPVAPAPAAPPLEVERILLEVVAELTGYPIEMLDADMDLEADLGIDSIKRVEILASLQERVPEMQAVNSSYIGGLRTLRNIIEYIREPAAEAPKAPQISANTSQVIQQKTSRLERRVLRAVELTGIDRNATMTHFAGKPIWITEDGAGVAQALCDTLVSQGVKARTISAAIDQLPADLAGLVIVSSPASVKEIAWPAESEQAIKSQFALIQRAAAALQRSADSGTALLATVSRMDGVFGLYGERFDPVQGGLAGLVKTAAHEWPDVRCRAIDVAGDWTDASAIAASLVAELASDGPLEVGLDSRKRCGLEAIAQPAAPGDVELHDGDAVIITGGARGVTAAAAIALAKACRPTLVLFGRSAGPQPEPLWLADAQTESAMKHAIVEHQFAGQRPSPADVEAAYRHWAANRQIAETLSAIERSGGRVVYRSLDVRDAAAVAAAVQEVRQEFGPIRGLVHGAGVIEDRLISDKQLAQFGRVFDTKVAGLRNLLAAVEANDLRFLALFSSVSGRFGRQGQSDYAAANEVLNKAAQRISRSLPGCRVVSLAWGPWQGGMVTPALEQEFRRIGVGLIPLEAGALALVEELSSANAGEAEVLIGDGFPAAPTPKPAPAKRIETVDDASPAFERRLDVKSHAFLRSHVIGGRPVLPAAIMLEWLGHAALHENPGLQLAGFDDFRVLRGVALDNGACMVRGFASRCRRSGDNFEVDAWLSAESAGQPNARTSAILVSKLSAAPQYVPPADLRSDELPASRDDIYGGILFHGSHFQGIDRIVGCSKRGMVARLFAAPAPSDWMDEPLRSSWLGDPLVIDVGLQLGILWSHQHLGAMSLPSFVKRYRQYRLVVPAVEPHRGASGSPIQRAQADRGRAFPRC